MQEDIRIADGAFEERLGYKFSTRELLERALTHSSAVPELRAAGADEVVSALLPRDNERLEFLGDAVLELLTSEHLLVAFPDWSEGQLSKSRARIVNAGSLEAAARRLRLGEHLRLGRGEEKTGGREKQTLLADAFEAVVAAVYLDGGLGAAREVLRRILFEQALEERGIAADITYLADNTVCADGRYREAPPQPAGSGITFSIGVATGAVAPCDPVPAPPLPPES